MYKHTDPIIQGTAEVVFSVNDEIIALYPQAVNIARGFYGVNSPSIGPSPSPTVAGALAPIGDLDAGCSETGILMEALFKGGCWICVSPLSDLPAVGILDLDERIDLSFERHHPNIIWVGYDPVLIERPIRKPVLVPPMARYVWNHRNVVDLYDISGERDNVNITSGANGYFAHYVTMHFGRRPPPKLANNNSQIIRWRLIKAITHAQADAANTRQVYCPTFAWGSDMAAVSGRIFAIATNTDVHTWYIDKYYHGLQMVSTAGLIMNAILASAKVTNANASMGNKIRCNINISSDGAGVGTIATNAILEVQNGGYYE